MMKLTVGNWFNDYVTDIAAEPSIRQLLNAMTRMHLDRDVAQPGKLIFRDVPVGDRNPSSDQCYEWSEIVANHVQ